MRLSGWKCAVLVLLASTSVQAAVKTWTGLVDRNWSTPGNWSDGTAPVNGDALVFPNVGDVDYGTVYYTSNNDIASGLDVQSLTIAQAGPYKGYNLTGNEIRVSGGITLSDSAVVSAAVTLTGPQTIPVGYIEFRGPFDLNGNTLTTQAYLTIRDWRSASGNLFSTGKSTQTFIHGSQPFTGTITTQAGAVTEIVGPFNGAEVTTSGRVTLEGALSNTTVTDAHFEVGRFKTVFASGGSIIASLSTGNFVIRNSDWWFDVSADETPGTGYDQLKVNGSVTLDNVKLGVVLPCNPAAGSYCEESWNPTGPPPRSGQQFVIIDNDGTDPVVGTFKGLPEGAVFSGSGWVASTAPPTIFQITYAGGTGNDVVLTSLGQPRRRRSVR